MVALISFDGVSGDYVFRNHANRGEIQGVDSATGNQGAVLTDLAAGKFSERCCTLRSVHRVSPGYVHTATTLHRNRAESRIHRGRMVSGTVWRSDQPPHLLHVGGNAEPVL